MRRAITYENVADDLVARVPEFAGKRRELAEECGETLPHVLFAFLFDFAVETRRAFGGPGRWERPPERVLRDLVELLEDAAHSTDPRVIDLLLSSFMETFDPNQPLHESITRLFEPESQKLLVLSRT